MIDHLCLRVPAEKFEETVKFYLTVLAPLGYKQIIDAPTFAGFGETGPNFSIVAKGENTGNEVHFSFVAKDRASIKAFYDAAIAIGAKDNGPPGPRSYHANYFGAFVLDPVGNNVEACCHKPE